MHFTSETTKKNRKKEQFQIQKGNCKLKVVQKDISEERMKRHVY